MDDQEILQKVQSCVAAALGRDEEEVTPEKVLARDLEAESIDYLDITFHHARQQLDPSWSTALDKVVDHLSHHTTSVVMAAGIQISVSRHGDPQRRQWIVMWSHARSLAPVPVGLIDEIDWGTAGSAQ